MSARPTIDLLLVAARQLPTGWSGPDAITDSFSAIGAAARRRSFGRIDPEPAARRPTIDIVVVLGDSERPTNPSTARSAGT